MADYYSKIKKEKEKIEEKVEEFKETNVLKKKRLIDTKDNFIFIDILDRIPEEHHEKEIWIRTDTTGRGRKSNSYTIKFLREYLNERFILYQLGLIDDSIINMSHRDLWYFLEDELKIINKEKLKLTDKERIILANKDKLKLTNKERMLLADKDIAMDCGFDGDFRPFIERYCEEFKERVGIKYWLFLRDELKIRAKARGVIYEVSKDEYGTVKYKPVGLDFKTVEDYTDDPFFLVLCEKEGVIKAFLKELIERGFNKDHFHCINIGGIAPGDVIRLIRRYNKIKNFHCFVLHDMDISGLGILLNIRKHFPCESIGVNPDLLEYCKYDFNKMSVKYRDGDTGKELPTANEITIETVKTVLNELDIPIEEWEIYNKWFNMCIERKVELNAITAHRIRSDPLISKTVDFVDYFVHFIEEKKWNLNRLRDLKKFEKIPYTDRYRWTIKTHIPRVDVYPDFIWKFDKEDAIENKINEEYKDYLDAINEIDDLITNNTRDIKEKLENIKDAEEETINDKIGEIKKEYPKIFDGVSWREVLQSVYPGKVEKMNDLIEWLEKRVQFRNKREYIKLKRQLENYIGSIKDDIPEKTIRAKEQELREYTKTNTARKNAIKMKRGFNKHLQLNLRRTIEYKEVKADITKLKEELEEREEKEDKRLELLNNFKEKLEEVFTELIGELDKFEGEISE